MTDQVTRLVVRADGALATLGRFEKGMAGAGKATDYTSGAVASFEKRMAAASAAIERGNAVATQTVARKTQEERAWEKWSATVDRTTGLRIKLERESAQAAVAASNAVNMGYTTQEQALTTLMALERRHAAQLSAHIAAENGVAVAYTRTAAAAEQASMATTRLSAANSNRGAGNFNTANVAAQFQDIAVTSAMGMSPLQIALQQGTQLSAVLGGQGLTGVVKTLGAAFASVVSPVSLITLGVVALGSYGIQALMGMTDSTDDANEALSEHNEWLDRILAGYEDAREAAKSAADAALTLPKEAVESDLSAGREAALERFRNQLSEIDSIQASLMGDLNNLRLAPEQFAGVITIKEQLTELSLNVSSTEDEFANFITTMTRLKNDSSIPQAYRNIADRLLGIANAARSVRGEADGATASLQALAGMSVADWTRATGGLQGVEDAVDSIKRMTPELRSQREIVNDIFSQNIGEARTIGEINALVEANNKFNDALSEQERRAQALKDARSGAGADAKTLDQWGSSVEGFEQRIASQRLEIDLLGKSTYEIERQRAAFDLLNQAKQAGIPITSEVTDQINALSAEYAAATVEMQRQAEAQQLVDDQMNFARSTFTGFFGDLKSGLRSGATLWESLGEAGANALDKIADRALSMAANGLFDMIFGSLMGGITGGLGGGGAGFLGGGTASWGPSFAGGGYTGDGARTGGLDGQGGFLAMLHPRETVTDHTKAANQNQSGGGDIYITNQINVPAGTSADVAPAIAREVTKELRRQIPDAIQAYNRNPLRRAG